MAWVRRFVHFHGRRHPQALSAEHVEEFLNSLVTGRGVSASTHQQALCALLFLYRTVLRVSAPWLDGLVRPRRSLFLPVVLTRQEARALLDRMEGTTKLMASLLYGSGLRLLECAGLRIKDIDFGNKQILIRRGKGGKDRVTLLPASLEQPLRHQIASVRRQYEDDLLCGAGFVELPGGCEPSTRMQIANGRGNGCFRRRDSMWIENQAKSDGTTFTKRSSSEHSKAPCAPNA